MPNQPKTPMRAVRVDEELWGRVSAAAEEAGMTRSDLVRAALEREVRRLERKAARA